MKIKPTMNFKLRDSVPIKRQPLIYDIKNCRHSSLFMGCSPLQLLCNRIVNYTQLATFNTANRQTAQMLKMICGEKRI
jgi:hypothetical protein